MDNPFRSAAVFVSPSLNRVHVAELPGPQFSEEMRGLSGFDLLGAASLRNLINTRAAALKLQAEAPDLLIAFDRCFDSAAQSVRKTAQQIAREYGRHLGLLLLTLKRADPANRLARPSWGEQHWAFWQEITTVYAGGGLLSGSMGPIAVAGAQEALADGGFEEMSVHLAPFAAYLPMVGLARKGPPNARGIALLDFGQTAVKRGIALYEPEKQSRLELLSAVETSFTPGSAAYSEQEMAEVVAEKLVRVAAQSWQETAKKTGQKAPIIGLSLACYLVNGHPPPAEMGYYGRLQLLSSNLQEYLAARISKAIGQSTQLFLAHDGSAAALTCAGSPHTAVLMLGTAVGVGFPPESSAGLRELASAVERKNLF